MVGQGWVISNRGELDCTVISKKHPNRVLNLFMQYGRINWNKASGLMFVPSKPTWSAIIVFFFEN